MGMWGGVDGGGDVSPGGDAERDIFGGRLEVKSVINK